MHRHYDTLPSTNDAAREWAGAGAPHLAVVSAHQQTAGRGRRGRDWVSPPGRGLYCSFVLRPSGGLEVVPRLTLLLALATCRATDDLTSLRAEVKWPNDVLLRGRKIAGILCEAQTRPHSAPGSRSDAAPAELDFCVAGVGLNLNFLPEELPARPVFPASSLRIETGREFDSEVALQSLLSHFRALDERFASGAWEALRSEWESRCHGLGSTVKVSDGATEWRGTALMVDSDGALLVGTPQGLRRVLAGDVTFEN